VGEDSTPQECDMPLPCDDKGAERQIFPLFDQAPEFGYLVGRWRPTRLPRLLGGGVSQQLKAALDVLVRIELLEWAETEEAGRIRARRAGDRVEDSPKPLVGFFKPLLFGKLVGDQQRSMKVNLPIVAGIRHPVVEEEAVIVRGLPDIRGDARSERMQSG